MSWAGLQSNRCATFRIHFIRAISAAWLTRLCLQVVWTSGERSILLWCAYTGAYLGALISKEPDPALEGETEVTSTTSEREERKSFIDSSKVLVHCQSMHMQISLRMLSLTRPSRTVQYCKASHQDCVSAQNQA